MITAETVLSKFQTTFNYRHRQWEANPCSRITIRTITVMADELLHISSRGNLQIVRGRAVYGRIDICFYTVANSSISARSRVTSNASERR